MGGNQEVKGVHCLEHKSKLVCVVERGIGGKTRDNTWSRGESWWWGKWKVRPKEVGNALEQGNKLVCGRGNRR